MNHQRVLVVEDDASVAEVISEMLAMEGYEVQATEDGIHGLEAVAERPPDVILLDMNLPRMDGWRFCAELDARHLHIPVVVMTAGPYDAWAAAEEVHAAAYLAKPFDIDELVRTVETLCPPR